MKNFLIEFFRPLDNLIFNYFVKIGAIKPFWQALATIGGSLLAKKSADKSRKAGQESEAKSQAQIDEAFEKIRDPIEIILEAYGPEGLYSEEVMGSILGAESKFMGPMTDLLKEYGQTMAFGEGGLDELSKQTTESILGRIKELGPEFRQALEDPRMASLLEEQISNFKKSYVASEGNAEALEATAKEFDAGLKSSLQQAGVSIDTINQAEVSSAKPFLEGAEGFDTSRLRGFDLSGIRDLSFDELKNLPMDQSSAFLGDIRGLTDIERAEAQRLTEAARGPLGFESIRSAEQAARAEGGALGRQLDASALARAALGREGAVMAREDRAADARGRAAQMAGLGGKLGLSQESLRGDLATTAAKLGLTQQQLLAQLGLGAEEAASKIDLSALGLGAEIGLGLDKLGLAREELASGRQLDLAKIFGTFGAQARQDAISAREEGRAGFRDVFSAAQATSVDPSSIFIGEAAPGFNLYSSIISQKPGTIFTDPGFALNVGSQYDTTLADILLGGAGISASQAAGQYSTAGDMYNTAFKLFGDIDYGNIFGKKDSKD